MEPVGLFFPYRNTYTVFHEYCPHAPKDQGDIILSLNTHLLKVVLILTLPVLLLFSATASAQASSVLGVWVTEKSEKGASMAVEIFECGERLCGKAVDVFNAENRDSVGLEIIKNMRKKTDTSFNKGKIYAPDTKKWYKSKMSLKGDNKLKVSGCVLGGVICRSQTWTRQE